MLNEKIIKIKNKLYSEKIEKTGKNTFHNFNFFELKDFLPKLIQFMNEEEINDQFTIENNEAILILNYKEEKNTYKIPFVMFDTPLNKLGKESMQPIQYLGALNTYYKRYLYLNAFSIAENDVIDSMEQTETKGKNEPKTKKDYAQTKKNNNKKEVSEKDRPIMIKYINENDEIFNEVTKTFVLDKSIEETPILKLQELCKRMKNFRYDDDVYCNDDEMYRELHS